MNILQDLKYRGLIYQITDEKELAKRLASGPITLYCGFDPSAESLQLGNLLQILVLKRFKNAGHKPIAIAGGGTGMIGDPSGKSEERPLETKEVIDKNLKKIEKELKNLLGNTKVVNNYDWLSKMQVIEYLRDVGKHFPVNYMLAKETIKSRLNAGISFTEFNYMILQAIDFMELYQKHNCELQIGGSDQWGNITAGVDLVRRVLNKAIFGLTVPLVIKSDGSKFGKTEAGTVWLNPNMTSPYQFYQFWINTADADVIKFIKYFTFLNKNEIEKLAQQVKANPAKRQAQKVLAAEVTKLVHGQKAVTKAKKISQALFYGKIKELSEDEMGDLFTGAPSHTIKNRQVINLVDLLAEAGIVSSKRQAREDVQKGAITLNGEKCNDVEKVLSKKDLLYKKYLIIKKGKKNYFLIKW